MKNHFLMQQAQHYLELFARFMDSLHYAYDEFREHLERYQHEQDPRTTVDLQSSVAHFERFVLPLISTQQAEVKPLIEDSGMLTLGVDGNWRAYEFRQFFSTASTICTNCTP